MRAVSHVLTLTCAAAVVASAQSPGDWAGSWSGERVTLELATAPEGWTGRMSVDGTSYPLRARSAEEGLAGDFEAHGQRFAFRARLRADGTLELSSDGNVHVLRRAPPAGQGTAFAHPAGHLGFELPPGWSIQGEEDGVLAIDAAQQPGAPREALVLAMCGELEEEQRGQEVTALLAALGPQLEQELAALQLRFPQGTPERPQAVKVGDAPGAVVTWRGVQGEVPVKVWLGGLLGPRHGWFVLVGILQEGREARYLPGLERLHRSVRLAGPPPAPAVAPGEELAGMEFASSSTTPAGSFFTWFEFHANGRVTKTLALSGAPRDPVDVDANSDSAGPYTVEGDVVTVRLGNDREQLRIVREEGKVVALMRGTTRMRRTR